ncbi:hypothetical protein [Alysiella filiformis]|uniref:hypothetical protein n=1 Tax=Alysiella filiformis TaxID=194196 RepID=UPI000BE30CCE|nr:hypothetical protein [Alysiella filiformis]QMT31193.1 hypothetical protein H3L97_10860 [Alysiella filiformis]UBQ55812.1 hypothetical protein JF568_09610 [Alysiella filiformis DSM 16848]
MRTKARTLPQNRVFGALAAWAGVFPIAATNAIYAQTTPPLRAIFRQPEMSYWNFSSLALAFITPTTS